MSKKHILIDFKRCAVETVNIAAVVAEQIALVEPIAKSKGIVIKQPITSDAMIEIDKNHLALIIRNLLQDALKFTHSVGKIAFGNQYTEASGFRNAPRQYVYSITYPRRW